MSKFILKKNKKKEIRLYKNGLLLSFVVFLLIFAGCGRSLSRKSNTNYDAGFVGYNSLFKKCALLY